MKLGKIKTICSEFGNDTFCSLSFNRIKSVESDDNNIESPETTDDKLNTIVEELPYVYTINTDLKNINIGFSKNKNDADILDDDFEPGILTLAQLSHIVEPYSNDFNVVMNAANDTEGGLNVSSLTNFSFNKEFLNHYLFSFLKKDSVFIVGEVNKDRFFDEPNTLLILTKVYYENTFTNYSYDYGSENISIISPDVYNYDTHKNYNNAILMCNITFNSVEDLDHTVESPFTNISFDDICIIRNRDNKDIFNELISLLFDANLDENSGEIIDYTFKHYNVKSVVDYLESVKYVIYEEIRTITITEEQQEDVKVNKATPLYTETPETIQSDISNYQKQAEIDLTKLYNRIEFSDITTNILDGVIHKNFYTDIENDKSYYIDTQDSFKEHINKVVKSILGTLEKINKNEFIPPFIEQRDTVLTNVLGYTYEIENKETKINENKTIAGFCADNASLEYNHDTSAYYLIDTINYVVNYENGERSSKMYFNMLNTDDLTNTLKLGNNIIYEYEDNTTGESPSGKKLNFSSKNIDNKLNKFTHYFYDDMDFGTIMLETKSDLPLVNDTQSTKNNVLFIDNTDALHEIYIPNCITSLGDGLFSNCEKLSLLELPKHLTSIGKNVFPNYADTNRNITIGYAKNSINSRSWLNKEFTGTYNYYAPNYNGYNTLLFYPTLKDNKVDIRTIGYDDIDIVSIGKQSITPTNSENLNIILDSTTEYIDDDAINFEEGVSVTNLTITATNSPLWYFDISKYNTKFDNINMLLNTLSPVCLYYDKEKLNPIYTYNNETFRDIQRNALSRIFKTAEPENLDDLIELQNVSPKLSVTNIDDIHLITGCKILNNEIRFIKRTNLTNDTFSLFITRQSVANYIYTAGYEFIENVRITETLGENTYYAKYTMIESSFCESIFSKAPRHVFITDIFGELANTLKTIYIKLDNGGFFVDPSFDYNANYGSNGDITLTPIINENFKVKTNNAGSADEYELLHNFLDNTDLDIKQCTLSNDGVDYNDFKETLNSLNINCLNIESNFINTGGLQYRTKAETKILDSINIFPLFFTTNSIYNGSIKMFLKTTDQLYSIQLSDIKTLSEIGISKLLLNDKFNPRLIEFPESINRFYDCPIIIDETYDNDELTLRFWSNFEDIISRKTLLDIDAIQRQIASFSPQSVIQGNLAVSIPTAGSVNYPTFSVNTSPGVTASQTVGYFGKPYTPNTTIGFIQNNNVLCICTNSDSLEKLICINSEKLKTLRIQVKDGEDYEHIYNFFKTNINKLIQMNTSNNHVLNIVVEKFVHMNNVDSTIATYNFYDI